jgi:hypothetical protein
MTNSVKIIPEEITLFHIDILESSIKDVSDKKQGEFNINVAHSTMHNLNDQRVKIGLFIDLSTKNNPNSGKANFRIDFHFHINNLNNFYEVKQDKQPVFSWLLIATLLGLSFSTARGIIFERLSNTNLKHIILPVVDPKNMMPLQKK